MLENTFENLLYPRVQGAYLIRLSNIFNFCFPLGTSIRHPSIGYALLYLRNCWNAGNVKRMLSIFTNSDREVQNQ